MTQRIQKKKKSFATVATRQSTEHEQLAYPPPQLSSSPLILISHPHPSSSPLILTSHPHLSPSPLILTSHPYLSSSPPITMPHHQALIPTLGHHRDREGTPHLSSPPLKTRPSSLQLMTTRIEMGLHISPHHQATVIEMELHISPTPSHCQGPKATPDRPQRVISKGMTT